MLFDKTGWNEIWINCKVQTNLLGGIFLLDFQIESVASFTCTYSQEIKFSFLFINLKKNLRMLHNRKEEILKNT